MHDGIKTVSHHLPRNTIAKQGIELPPTPEGCGVPRDDSSDSRLDPAGEEKNWLRNPDLAQGAAAWEARPPNGAVVAAAGADGRPVVGLERAPGPGEPVVWCQQIRGLSVRRQVTLTASVCVEEGEAELWVRCRGADGVEIRGRHLWAAPKAAPAAGWQSLAFSFVVPAETDTVEVGGVIPHRGRGWFSDFALRLIPDDDAQLRAALVETLVREGSMPTDACRRAFLRVPRHRFLPNSTPAEAYLDNAIITHVPDAEGRGSLSSSSQPSVMTAMVGQLRLRPGLRVLEIGAGTGYNAAILAEIVGAANVVSIDLDAEIAAEARAHLDSAGYREVFVDAVDGWDGCPARAPYDRIVITAGVHDLSPAWVEQLREGGVLVAPFSFRGTAFTPGFRKQDGRLVSERISRSFFMDLRGKHPRHFDRRWGDRSVVTHDALDEAALAALDKILDGPAEPFSLPEMRLDSWQALADFRTFAALANPMALSMSDPRLTAHGIQDRAFAFGIADLKRRQLALSNVCFGGPEIGEAFRGLAREWLAMGQPGLDRLVMAAYPRARYPDAARLPGGRWSGLIEKEHAWFGWRYRADEEAGVGPAEAEW